MLDELDRVHAFGAQTSDPDEAAVNAARGALLAAIKAEPARSARHSRLKAKPARRLVLAAAFACAVLGVAGVIGLHAVSDPQSALAAQINRLATVAESHSWGGIPGPGQYLSTSSIGSAETDTLGHGKECVVVGVGHRHSWIATDGSGALSQSFSRAHFTSQADRATCAELKVVNPTASNYSESHRFGPGGLGFITRDWHRFSTNAATLLKQVHRTDGGPDTPAEWFTNIGDFLRESDAPPAIRSALYRAAALIPGIRLIGRVTDPVGRTGIALGYPGHNGQLRFELIIDSRTGRLLAEKYFDSSGKLAGWSAYLRTDIVNRRPNYPLVG